MQSTSFGTLMICWWPSLCASFTNFKNSKLEQTGTLLMGAMLMPMSSHMLFSSFKTKSFQHVELRVSLSSHVPVDAQQGDRTRVVLQHSLDCGGMPWLCPHPPSPFPVPFQLSPSLLYVLPQTVSACLVLTPFFLFARLISLCPYIFSLVLCLLDFYWFCPLLCYMQVRSTDCLGAVSVCGTDTICTCCCWCLLTYLTSVDQIHTLFHILLPPPLLCFCTSPQLQTLCFATLVSWLVCLYSWIMSSLACVVFKAWWLSQVPCVSKLPSTVPHLWAPGQFSRSQFS